MVIVRVQYLYDISCQIFLLYGFSIITFVERLQLEVYDWLCIPDAKGIDYIIAISNDRHVVRNSQYRLISLMNKVICLCICIINNFYMTAETNLFCILRTTQFEWVTIFQPVIRNLYLITVLDFLFEHTITVTNTAAICTISQSSQGIQEACCKTSKATVSKCRVRLLILNDIQIKSQFIQSFADFFLCF